jgi:hypothetical protein
MTRTNDVMEERPSEPAATSSTDGREREAEADPAAKPEQDPEAALIARAVTLWAAKKAEDWATVFEFDAARNNPDVTRDQFVDWAKENEPFVIVDYAITDAVAEGQYGWVALTSTTTMRQYPAIPPRTHDRWEKWRLEEDGWRPVPLDVVESYPIAPANRSTELEPALWEAARESWDARLEDDWETAYRLSDPRDYERVDYDQFVEGMAVSDYQEYRIAWVEATGDTARVFVTFRHKWNDPNMTKLPPEVTSQIEPWVRVDGQWVRDLTQE